MADRRAARRQGVALRQALTARAARPESRRHAAGAAAVRGPIRGRRRGATRTPTRTPGLPRTCPGGRRAWARPAGVRRGADARRRQAPAVRRPPGRRAMAGVQSPVRTRNQARVEPHAVAPRAARQGIRAARAPRPARVGRTPRPPVPPPARVRPRTPVMIRASVRHPAAVLHRALVRPLAVRRRARTSTCSRARLEPPGRWRRGSTSGAPIPTSPRVPPSRSGTVGRPRTASGTGGHVMGRSAMRSHGTPHRAKRRQATRRPAARRHRRFAPSLAPLQRPAPLPRPGPLPPRPAAPRPGPLLPASASPRVPA